MKQLNLMIVGLLLLSLALPMQVLGQKASKISQSIKVDDNVTVELNTSFCNIELDTWNKDVVEIEAYIDGEKLSQEELQQALKDWKVDIDASASLVTISTNDRFNYNWTYDFRFEDDDAVRAAMEELKIELAEIPEINITIPEFELPMMADFPDLPELPEGISRIHFDYEAYKRDGEKYMKEWNEEFEEHFGEDYEKKMEAWAEKFSKEWEAKYGKEWEEKFGKQMEEWGEKFGKEMEEWSKKYEEQMGAYEKRMEESEKLAEERVKAYEKREEARVKREQVVRERVLADEHRAAVEATRRARIETMMNSGNTNLKKVIKLKVPKKAKLKLNVKHGELKLANNITNLKANLEHTKLTASSINGSETSINVSYAPVVIDSWGLGKLNLNYVDSAKLSTVQHLVLSSNSSNVYIDRVNSNAIVDGSFGVLKILKVDSSFSGLNLILQNSDMLLVLPQTDFNLQFKGNQTFLKHPKNGKKELIKQFSLGQLTNPKTIIVNAKFSDVKLQ